MKAPRILPFTAQLLSVLCLTTSQAATLYSSAVLKDAPLAYWSFDESDGNATQQAPLVRRTVTTENDLQPLAGAGRVSHAAIGGGLAKLGLAADFGGANCFWAPALLTGRTALTGAYAVEFWMQVQGENTSDRADYLVNIGDNGPGMIFDFKPDQLEMFAGSRTDNGPRITDSAWHHVLFVYYGDGTDGVEDRVDAYLDGTVYPGIGNLYSKRLDLSQLTVGAALGNGANGFQGRVDEVAIYDLGALPDSAAVTAKTSTMVTRHISTATGGPGIYAETVRADGPLLYWNFDEPEGNARQQMPVVLPVPDNSLNELAPQYGAVRISHGTARSGLQLGNALDLTGQGDFFGKTGGLDLGVGSVSGPWAVEFWFQLKADQSSRYLLNMGSAGVGYNSPAIIYGFLGSTLEVYGAGSGRSGTNGVPLNDRNWHHLLVVNHSRSLAGTGADAGNRVDFHLDGVLRRSVGGSFDKDLDFRDWVFFGSAVANPDPTQSGSVNALLDELAFYDLGRFETAEELTEAAARMAAAHYAAAFGGDSVGTISLITQPASAVSQIGGSASFTASATVTGTTFPLTYEWQRNEANIVGATNATYLIPTLSINDIGTNRFRVRVSAGPVFKFSDSASLRVPMPASPPPTLYSRQVLSDSPVFYWNFDEFVGDAFQVAAVPFTPATTENDLVSTGSAQQRVSHAELTGGLRNLGRAVVLDGSSFLMADSTRLARPVITNAYAVETWVRLEGGQNEYLANFGPAGSDNTPALIHNFTQPGFLELYGEGGRVGNTAVQVVDTEWHHLLWVVYNNAPAGRTNRVDIYFDGALKTDVGNGFGRHLDLRRILLGAATAGGNNAVAGALDEFAAYDFAGLTADQISARAAAIATNHFAAAKSASAVDYSQLVLADQPTVYYNFEEASGNARQRAPVTLPPPNNAANTLVSAGALRLQHHVAGTGLELGNAADFNGVSYFRAAAPEPPKPTLRAPWAVELWFQVQGDNADNRQDYLLNFENAPALIYDFNPDELEIYAGVRTAGGPTVSDQQWHHLMWVFYGDGNVGVADRADAYLDGTLIPGVRSTYTGVLGLSRSIVVGAAQPGLNGFQGRVDEVAIYDLASLPDENAVTEKVSAMVTRHLNAARTVVPTIAWSRQGSRLTLTWLGTGFRLQQNASLANPAAWVDVPNGADSPSTVNLDPIDGRFFRLIQR